MRHISAAALAAAFAGLIYSLPATAAQDSARVVANGGVSVPGWTGKIDANEEKMGQQLTNAKLAPEGSGMRVTTGPATTYWNPNNKASGNYTVKATFTEPLYMNLNNHPHPYGIMIAGNDLGTANQSMLYCSAYGDGRFIVRGFGPAPFQVNGRGEPNAAINKAAGKDQPVKQEVAVSVAGDKVTCSVNGTVVGTYDKAALVAPGRLKSTDGVYGLRFGHNTDVKVTGFGMSK